MVSVSVPVDPSCKYDDLACFSTFGDTIQFVGGINKPKLVQCFDRYSHGRAAPSKRSWSCRLATTKAAIYCCILVAGGILLYGLLACMSMGWNSNFAYCRMRILGTLSLHPLKAKCMRVRCCSGVCCSAGVRHRQLVKSGNDDLRQDAVMQQLFGLINEVLAHSPATAKRRLRIVTYKVILLYPTWCWAAPLWRACTYSRPNMASASQNYRMSGPPVGCAKVAPGQLPDWQGLRQGS